MHDSGAAAFCVSHPNAAKLPAARTTGYSINQDIAYGRSLNNGKDFERLSIRRRWVDRGQNHVGGSASSGVQPVLSKPDTRKD